MSQIPVPELPKVWMQKPRSQKTDGGFLSRFRGAGSWQRRCVYVKDSALGYSEGVNDPPLKTIPLETLTAVERVSKEKMIKDEAPSIFADFGWSFSYKTADGSKNVVFACEAMEVREAWVNALETFLDAMKMHHQGLGGGGSGGGGHGGGGGGAGGDNDHGNSGGAADATSANFNSSNQQAATTLAAMAAGDAVSGGVTGGGGGDDEEGDDTHTGRHTRDQLRKMMGEGDDDGIDLEGLDWANDEEDEDDDDDSDDDDDGGAAGGGGGKKKGKEAGARQMIFDAPRLQVERHLKSLAQKNHSHIAFKMEKYAPYFKEGETTQDVVFSRSVCKISKKNNKYDRDLVLTKAHLYLFQTGGFLSSIRVKIIDLDQIVGVVESTENAALFALLIPAWHDVLLTIAPQNSVLGGTEDEVKKQLIAHLYLLLETIVPGRQFIFREAANVPSIIRRSEDDQHQPLRSEEGDKLRVASKPDLYPKFRVHAESVVYLSCTVQRVNAEMSYSPRIFIVTDGGVYLAHVDGERISKRASLTDISLMKCDSEMHGIFLRLPEMDMVVYATNVTDYQGIVRWVPEAAMRSSRHKITVQGSRNLLDGARLMEAKKLMEHFSKAGASTEDTLKALSKFAMRATKASWKFSKTGIAAITKNVENIGRGSVDLLTRAGQEVGGLLLDNAITGELRGLGEQMLSMTGAVQSRLVSERILKLGDVEKHCSLKERTTDTLKMFGTPALSTFGQGHKDIDTTTIFFSARCKHFPLAASIDTSRSSDRFIVLTATGILLFDDPSGSSGSVVTGSKTLLTRAFKTLTGGQMGLQLHESIKWNETRGVVRCVSEPNVVGILNNTSVATTLRDVMIRLPNSKLADAFEAHFINLYGATMTPKPGMGYWKLLAGDYASPTADHLRHALKASAFEQDPNVALRIHPLGGDDLRIAVDNMIVDRIRKYGDNSVRFSSLAWRLKTSTVRKDPTQALKAATEQTTEAGSHGVGLDRKLYKQCGLVLTNCAVYQFEDGSKQINRRVELYQITRIKINNADPDAVLLVVPREFDFFIRIEGRAQEFVDKLVEAKNEWTDYELELPVELDGESYLPLPLKDKNKELAQHKRSVPLPIDHIAEAVFNVGKLVKPKDFSDEQGRISSEFVLNAYVDKLMKMVRAALDETEIAHPLASLIAATSGGANSFKSAATRSQIIHSLQQQQSQQGDNFLDWDTDKNANASPTVAGTSPSKTSGGGSNNNNNNRTLADFSSMSNLNAQQSMAGGVASSGDGSDLILHMERVIAQLRYAVERAFAFGLRPQQDECADLARGLTLLEFHRKWRDILGRLQKAAQEDALADFKQGENLARDLKLQIEQKFSAPAAAPGRRQPQPAANASTYAQCNAASSFGDAIQAAIDLQAPQLEMMKDRAEVKASIEDLIQRAATDGPEVVLSRLEDTVVRAAELGVSLEILDGFKASFDIAVQCFRISKKIPAYSWAPPLIDIFNEACKISNCSSSVATTSSEYFSSNATSDSMIVWALRTLEAAVNTGDLTQLELEIKAVETAFKGANDDGVIPQKVQSGLAKSKEMLNELQRCDPVIQDLKRIAGDFRRRVAHLSCEQLQNFENEFARIIEQLPSNAPAVRAARDTAFVLFSTVQLKRKAAELQEEAILEEKALAAAYSKSANDDAIASAQRYERAQRTKLEAQMKQRKKDMEEIAQRGDDLLFSMKRSVAAEDSESVTGLVSAIETLLSSMETMLARCISQEERSQHEEGTILTTFRQHLDEARALGAAFTNQFASRGGGTAVPPEAISAAQRLDAPALCRFVESGELDIASLKMLGELWQKAAEHKKALHRLRQRAFVIDQTDDTAVDSLLSDAHTLGIENDVVIAKVRETYQKAKRQKQKQQQQQSNNNNNQYKPKKDSNLSDGPQSTDSAATTTTNNNNNTTTKDAKFIPPASYDLNYYWVSQKGGGMFMDVHGALTAIFKKPHITDSPKEVGRYELPKEYFTNDIKDFCTRMEAFLSHRVKPAGFFRKTQRSLFDLISEIGKLTRSGGEMVAPFCAHLVGEFERVKKLNNSNGLTSDQVLVRLVLSKRDLQRIFDDYSKLNAKERENLFFEDSVWVIHDDVASKDMSLFVKMTNQIVWPFNFQDRRLQFDVSGTAANSTMTSMAGSPTGSPGPQHPSAAAGAGSLSRGALAALNNAAGNTNNSLVGGSNSFAGGAGGDDGNVSLALSHSIAPSVAAAGTAGGAGVGINCDVAVATLRHSVRLFSSFFQTEMRNLGHESTSEQRRAIFDETKTKMCGVLIRDEVCAAVALLFRSGLKQLGGIMSRFTKRSPWDIVVASTERMRQSAHGLSGIALPEAVDTVLGLTDPALASAGTSSRSRGVSAVTKMNQDQLNDVRFRIFVCYALNRKILSGLVLNAIFDSHNKSQIEFLHSKFYNPPNTLAPAPSNNNNNNGVIQHQTLLPICAFEDDECRQEIAKVFSYFEKMPFVLSLDAEIW